MRKSALFLLCFYLPSVLWEAVSANETKPILTWLATDWQPAWITEGPMRGQGYAQSTERMLRERMPDFEHRDRKIINVRTYSILKNTDACFAASSYQGADLTAEQHEGLIFSAPTFLFFYHGLIVHPEAYVTMEPHITDGYVSLSAILKDDALVGLYQPGRVYSRWIMPILAKDENLPNMFRWSSNSRLTQGMFRMLSAKRIDYFIDYSFMLKFNSQSTDDPAKFLYLPLTEHKDTVGLGSIACKDTTVGQAAISQINKHLATLRQADTYKTAVSNWLMPEGLEQEYWQLWEEELLAKTD